MPLGFIGPAEHPAALQAASGTYQKSPALRPDTSTTQRILPQPITEPLSSAYTLTIVPLANSPVELYGSLELGLETNLRATNPYDPQDIDLRVSFSAPSGKEVHVGAFWYQGYDPATRQPFGEPGWKVRFTPDEAGEWLAVASAPTLGLHSAPVSFTVKPSNRPGFIRINPKNSHYLAFDDGNFFFPIGLNMGWWSDCCDPVEQYNRWLNQFTANGGNTVRVWMASWSFGIEWKDTGLGNYDQRQYQAWLLDQLFRLAAERGVKIILVLVNHGAFSQQANTEWNDNPYNAKLGGPITSPEQFVSDPVAKAFFRQRLNYIVNRWGFSPDLMAWEWFNEVNLTPITDADLAPWLMEMTAFLRDRDVNQHLTTSSFAMRAESSIWQLDGLDIVQLHEYSSQMNESDHDLAVRAGQDFQELANSIPAKPILMGEFGYSAANYGDDIEKTGIHLHNGLWATTFSGYAGSGMYWWWDIYIDANNLWHQFKGLANFLYGEDLTQYQPIARFEISDNHGRNGRVEGMGLRGEDILVWMRSDVYTVQSTSAGRGGSSGTTMYMPPLVEGLSLILDDMDSGEYSVRWFDPQGAEWLDTQTATVHNHRLVIPIPTFRADLAAKITQNP